MLDLDNSATHNDNLTLVYIMSSNEPEGSPPRPIGMWWLFDSGAERLCTFVRTRIERGYWQEWWHRATEYPRKVVYPCVALALHRMDISLGPR